MPRNGLPPSQARKFRRRGRSFRNALTLRTRQALQRQGRFWLRRMHRQFRAPLTPYGSHNPHRTLHNRTNAMRSSLSQKVVGSSLRDMQLVLRGSHPGLRAQEYGAVIRPRSSRGWLAIPIDDNLFPAGGRRTQSPRDHPDGFFLSLGGSGHRRRLYFVKREDDDLKFLFAMRKRVTIPGPSTTGTPSRLGFTENAAGTDARRRFKRNLTRAVALAVRDVGR